jgi:hypothetical protein
VIEHQAQEGSPGAPVLEFTAALRAAPQLQRFAERPVTPRIALEIELLLPKHSADTHRLPRRLAALATRTHRTLRNFEVKEVRHRHPRAAATRRESDTSHLREHAALHLSIRNLGVQNSALEDPPRPIDFDLDAHVPA